jgi:ABC-2 type transport system permease protein
VNHRAGLLLIQNTWLSWMEQRSFFFIIAFGWMLPPLIYLFVWATAAGGGSVGGLTRDEFIVYYLIFIVVNQLTYSQTEWTVGMTIWDGSFSRLLLYPISPIYNTLANEIAGKAVFLTFVIPVTLGLALLLRPEVSFAPANVALFVPALLLAWMLRFLWGYWIALLAFWTDRLDGLLSLQNALNFILSGEVAPLALLPPFLQTVAMVLPFRYMIGFPVELVTGQLTPSEIATGFAMQLGWTLISFLLYRLVMHKGLQQYTAVGG